MEAVRFSLRTYQTVEGRIVLDEEKLLLYFTPHKVVSRINEE